MRLHGLLKALCCAIGEVLEVILQSAQSQSASSAIEVGAAVLGGPGALGGPPRWTAGEDDLEADLTLLGFEPEGVGLDEDDV